MTDEKQTDEEIEDGRLIAATRGDFLKLCELARKFRTERNEALKAAERAHELVIKAQEMCDHAQKMSERGTASGEAAAELCKKLVAERDEARADRDRLRSERDALRVELARVTS